MKGAFPSVRNKPFFVSESCQMSEKGRFFSLGVADQHCGLARMVVKSFTS